MRKIGIITNDTKDVGFAATKAVAHFLCEQGCAPMLMPHVADAIGRPEYAANSVRAIYTETAFLIVLGGDGAMLNAAKNAAPHGVAMLGLNMGTLGYLTDVEKGADFAPVIRKALDGEATVERRMMLEATLPANSEPHIALNDVCVLCGVFTNLIALELYINDEFIDCYRADGFIVATPTGSTAYNLSAGGPILKPDAEMIAVTPICPHMLHARPLVVTAEDVVKITLRAGAEAIVMLDGQRHSPFAQGDTVIVRRSQQYTGIIKTSGNRFFDVFRHKMVRGIVNPT